MSRLDSVIAHRIGFIQGVRSRIAVNGEARMGVSEQLAFLDKEVSVLDSLRSEIKDRDDIIVQLKAASTHQTLTPETPAVASDPVKKNLIAPAGGTPSTQL